MNKFEVVYEFDGRKMWQNVFAANEEDARNIILKQNNDKNIIILNVEYTSLFESEQNDLPQQNQNKKTDLSSYMNPAFKLSDESYEIWVNRLTGDNNDH